MANPIYVPITATGTYGKFLDIIQSPFNLTYAVEFAAGTTGSYTVSYTLDDPNDVNWTPVWISDPTNGTAQTATQGGFYGYPVRGIRVIFSALGGTAIARLAILQGTTS